MIAGERGKRSEAATGVNPEHMRSTDGGNPMPYALLLWARECRQLASGLHSPGSAMELLLYAEALEGEAGKQAARTKGRASGERSEAQNEGRSAAFLSNRERGGV
jgi:hypothetical protein